MASGLYRRFVNICKKWPLDESKPGRDYGQVMRDQFGQYFSMGEMSSIKNPKELDKQLAALERLADNHYCSQRPDVKKTSSSGLEPTICRDIVSTESLLELQKEEDSEILARLRQSLKMSSVKPKKN